MNSLIGLFSVRGKDNEANSADGGADPVKQRRKRRLGDLSGQKFGRLTVLSRIGNDEAKRLVYACRCDCGKHGRLSVWPWMTSSASIIGISPSR